MRFIESPNKTTCKAIPSWLSKDLIVIHWIAGSAKGAINWFSNPISKVSAHYVIDSDGNITQMVSEQDIAWHAGLSSYKDYPTKYNGHEWGSLNVCSIGIELEGPPSCVKGMKKWSKKMIRACAKLCREIGERHPGIKLTDHSRIAPFRKIDVIAGTGRVEDIFPWKEFVELTGLKEA